MNAESVHQGRRLDLTLAEVADELGVHYMTVYRYVRLGKLPARKQGRGWLIARDDLDGLVSPNSSKHGLTDAPPHSTRFLNRLLAFDQQGAWMVVETALASGLDPVGAYETIVIPALRDMGEQWADGTLSIAEEHAATGICQRIVGRLGSMVARRGLTKGAVVLSCPTNEHHGLATAIAADIFRMAGYDTIDCGSDLPTESLLKLVARVPRLVAVGVSTVTPGNEDAVAMTVDALRQCSDAPILLGGPGIESSTAAKACGADLWAPTATEGVALLKTSTTSEHKG